MTAYADKLRDPRWQRKRLEALEFADWSCGNCGAKESTLHVHHKRYIKGRQPWEYERTELDVLCEQCHGNHHDVMDLLARLLTQIDPTEALALLAGYSDYLESVDPEITNEAKQRDPLTFAAGFTASLSAGSIEVIRKVADYTVSFSRKTSGSRRRLDNNRDIFGS